MFVVSIVLFIFPLGPIIKLSPGVVAILDFIYIHIIFFLTL